MVDTLRGLEAFNQMVKSETARLDAVFHALADETRRSILRDVAAGEKTVSDVVRPYAMSCFLGF